MERTLTASAAPRHHNRCKRPYPARPMERKVTATAARRHPKPVQPPHPARPDGGRLTATAARRRSVSTEKSDVNANPDR